MASERRQAKRFHLARHENGVSQRDQALHVILLAQKVHVILHAEGPRQMFRRPALGAIANHQQPRVCAWPDFREDPNAVEHSLHRAEVGEMDQQFFAVGRELRRAQRSGSGV